MVPRQAFINKIRDLDYVFKGQQRRTYLYRRKMGLNFIAVPKSDLLEEAWVATNLKRAGLDKDQIQRFIGEAKA